jgi:glycosyltransferase involved in cell wall biosynthesis
MEMDNAEIGYILKGYPRTSETFISNEIYLLEGEGLRLSIFSLKKLEGQQRHGLIDLIKAPVTYLPQTTSAEKDVFIIWLWKNLPQFAADHWKLVRLRPMVYLKTLMQVLVMCMKYRAGAFAAPNWGFIKEFLHAGFIALKVLESGCIRHLHAHFCHTTTTVTMLASKLCHLPFSFTAHAKDIYRKDLNPGDLLSLKMRHAKFAVTCTKANQEYLDRFRPKTTPLYTIYHGLDLTLFTPGNDRSEKKDQTDQPLILSVGRLVEKKGFTYLVEACRLLKDRGYTFKCRIVGGADQYTETISSLVTQLNLSEDITLHHAVTQEELRGIYRQATVFALPCQVIENGDRDGIPNVLVEAMAMGLPVVSTNISGIPELIEDGVDGLLVPQKNAEALADALERLLNNHDLRQAFGKTARAKVCRHFDSKRNVIMLRDLFETSLRSSERYVMTERQEEDIVAYSRDRL